MKNKITLTALSTALLIGASALSSHIAGASAADRIGTGAGQTGQAAAGSPTVEQLIANVANILLFIVGAIAVIMIIISGIRYVVSQGDSGAVKSAKDTILYSVIGLIVAIFAYAIVNFVITNVV